jgi:predicted kinase
VRRRVPGTHGSGAVTETPLLIVVTGPPAAGKTTIAREVAARLRLPLLAKDTIKEALFDGLGTGDLEWSQRLGAGTFLALLALVEESIAAGASLVVEANFVRSSEYAARLARLPSRFVQVHCSAPLALLHERYGDRERHPGHVDAERIDALRDAVESGRHDPLDLPGETIRLDTSEPVEPESLLPRVRRAALWQTVSGAILHSPVAQAAYRGDDPVELAPLLDKVRRHAYRISDDDVAGLEPDTVIEATLGAALAATLDERQRALEAIR